jgi:hypothetical protein
MALNLQIIFTKASSWNYWKSRHLVNATTARPHWLELKPLEKSSISRKGNYIPNFYTVY